MATEMSGTQGRYGKFSPRAESDDLSVLCGDSDDETVSTLLSSSRNSKSKLEDTSDTSLTTTSAQGIDDGGDIASDPPSIDNLAMGDNPLKPFPSWAMDGPLSATRRMSYSIDDPIDFIRSAATSDSEAQSEAENVEDTAKELGIDEFDSNAELDEVKEEVLSEELVAYYEKMVEWMAVTPDGEVTTDEAEDILRYICSVPDEEHVELMDAGGLHCVYNIIDRSLDFEQLEFLACHTLRLLVSTTEGETKAIEFGVIEKLLDISEACSNFEDVTAVVLCTLAELACGSEGQMKMVKLDAHKTVHQILKKSDNKSIHHRRWGCAALAFIADGNPEGQEALLKDDVLKTLVRNLNDSSDGGVCQLAVLAIDRILRLPTARAKFYDGKMGRSPNISLKTLLQCIEKHSDNLVVQEHGCRAIQSLCEGSSSNSQGEEINAIRNSGTEEVLFKVAELHRANPLVSSVAQRTLAMLSDGYLRYFVRYSQATVNDIWCSLFGSSSISTEAPSA